MKEPSARRLRGLRQLELIKETFPDVSRVEALWNPANAVFQALQLREAQIAARALRIELKLLEARSPRSGLGGSRSRAACRS